METFKGYVDSWTNFIGTSITGLFLTVATAIFFYAVVRFILKRASGNTEGLQDAKSMLGWSVIGLTVMFSIWGIVSFLQSGILGENGSKTQITAPSITSGGNSGSSSGSGSASSGSGSTSGAGRKTTGSSCTIPSECISGICSSRLCSDYGPGAGRGFINPSLVGTKCNPITDKIKCQAESACTWQANYCYQN